MSDKSNIIFNQIAISVDDITHIMFGLDQAQLQYKVCIDHRQKRTCKMFASQQHAYSEYASLRQLLSKIKHIIATAD